MSDFVTPVVGQQYWLDNNRVTVTEAVKKRFWRIVVEDLVSGPQPDFRRTIPQAEWAAKALHVGAQG